MAHNATASKDSLPCSYSVDFGKCQGRFGLFSSSKNDSNYLDVNLEVFKRDDKRLSPGPNTHNGRSRFQLVHAIEEAAGHCIRNFWYRGKPVTSADTKDVERHHWTTQTGYQCGWRSIKSKEKDLCDSALVQYEEASQFSCSSPIFAKKKEEQKFQQNFLVNYKPENFIHLLDVMDFVYNKILTIKLSCKVPWKVIANIYSVSFYFFSSQVELEHWR